MIGQTLLNRYTVTTRLGKGAMGTVYRATDSQTGKDVAIKVIAQELAFDEAMLERFKREGEALRQLRHPNIVGFVDAFQHDDHYVLILEYVPGGSLSDLVKKGPLPIERARQIALELCDALTRAHYLNIVHRDLKPENVLIDTDGTPKLTDFGVARLVSEANRLTGTGTQIGTPYYMSPEAWEGKPLDAQADIWSLGVVLYEMVSGEVPFGGETLVAVMNKVLTASLPDIKTKRPDLPDGLAAIVGHMLTREKAARYHSMRELGADLERGGPIPVMPQIPAANTVPAYAPPTKQVPAVKAASPVPLRLFGLAGIGFVVLALAAGGIFLVPRLLGTLNQSTPPAITAPSNNPTTITSPTAPAVTVAPIVAGGQRPQCGAGETELFYDSFDDGNANGWAFSNEGGVPTGPWPVEAHDGSNVLVGNGHNWAAAGDINWSNYALSARVKGSPASSQTHLNILLNGLSRYFVNYPGGGTNKQADADTFSEFGQTEFPKDDDWHSLKLSAVDGLITISIDGASLRSVRDPQPLTSGQIALENIDGQVYYDDVLACQLPAETTSQSPGASSPEAIATAKADPQNYYSVSSGDSIVLGVAVDLTGNCAELGPDQRDAVLLALDEAGPVAGFGVRIVVADTVNPSGGEAAANQLIQKAVMAVIGTSCSGAMADALPVFDSVHLLVISPSASRNDFSQSGSDIFNRVVLKDADNPSGVSTVNKDSPQYQIFKNNFEAKWGRTCCADWTAEAYDATRILLQAIESVAVIDENGQLIIPSQALAQAVRGTKNYPGLSGLISFDENGDRILAP